MILVSKLGRRLDRLPPAVLFDLPVLVFLLVCWWTVAVALAHIITGLVLIGLIVVHLRNRRRRIARMFWRSRSRASAREYIRRFGYVALLVVTAGMAVSGILRWSGVPKEYAWHATSSYIMLTAAILHLLVVRRSLFARSRICRRPLRREGGTRASGAARTREVESSPSISPRESSSTV